MINRDPKTYIGETIAINGHDLCSDYTVEYREGNELLLLAFTIPRARELTSALWVAFDHGKIVTIETEQGLCIGKISSVDTQRNWTTFNVTGGRQRDLETIGLLN